MRYFFEAKKIAVVGASRNPEKVGGVIFDNLLKSPYLKVFPVNPNASDVKGVKAYTDVLEIPFPVDLAVIAVKAELVPDVLEQCGEKGIKRAIVVSAGFSEAGNVDLSEKVKEIMEKYDIKLIGPNVLGIINPYKNLNASFFKEMPEKGNVGFISQSGAVGTSLLDKALENHLGISSFVSLGNMVGEDFLSALRYFEQERYTEVLVLYVESLKPDNGRRFVEICKRISRKKKIIVIKAGKTEEGKKAAETHTASLSSSAKIYSGAFKQAGIIEVESLNELFKLAQISSKYRRLGKRACVITNAGGLGVLTVDTLVKAGFELPEIPEKILEELDEFLPKGYSRANPLDVLGDALAERYEKTLRVLSRRDLFDFFVAILSPQEMTQPLETARVLSQMRKPVFACFIGGKNFISARRFLKDEGVASFDDVSELEILGKFAN